MPELNELIEDVRKEVTKFGTDTKAATDSLQRDLANVRKLAEEAGKAAQDGTQLKKDIDNITVALAEKHAAIEKQVKDMMAASSKAADDRLNEIEKRVGKLRLSGSGSGGDEATVFKLAKDFAMQKAAVQGKLAPGESIDDDKVNVDEYKAYSAALRKMISNQRGERSLADVDAKALAVGSAPDGGYLVTPAMSSRIQTVIRESSPIRSIATVETITTSELSLPVDEDDIAASWAGETTSRTETATPQVGMQKIPTNELYAKPKATQQFIEDAGVDVSMWLSNKTGSRFGRSEATAFVSGNGVNKPRGFLTYASGSGRGKIEQVKTGHATLLTFDGLINLITALKGGYKANARFLIKRTGIGAVMLLKDSYGQYLWRPNNQAGQPSALLGYMVLEAEDMPDVGAGALPVAFGDFGAGYTIVDRLGISTLVDPYSAKPFVEFYSRARVGGDVTNFEAIKLQVVST